MLTIPTVSLLLAGALALVNFWLAYRVGQVRSSEKVSIGDGGNERVIRRMRAHANFAENAWIMLGLVLVIELSVGTNVWLWAAAAIYAVGRVLHGIGMDGWYPGRMAGAGTTMILQLALAIWAIAIPLTHGPARADQAIEVVPARG